jgi:Fic family protein
MPAPTLADCLRSPTTIDRLSDLLEVGPVPAGAYLHWDELRHRSPPEGLTAQEWWTGVKLARNYMRKPVPLRDKTGRTFVYCLPDPVLRLLHEVDQNATGGIQLAEEVTNPATRDRYIVNSLIEESITSSQLEGASTTSEVAGEMIRSGRRPTDRSERMIMNNYHAMRFVQQHRSEPLSPDRVFELHRIVTQETLEKPEKAGVFRTDQDGTVIEDHQGNVLHVPPAAAELPARLEALCTFANSRSTAEFIHPVIRAIVLHFAMGYDHPFVDGNGRTARALFYWSMLSDRYWLAEYISISRILKGAPSQYVRSYLLTETDEQDLTYFVGYQLNVISRAIEDLKRYLRKKMREIREVESLLRRSEFNHRQLALLSHALKHSGHEYTTLSHGTSHNVVPQTARTDLLDLVARGLLEKREVGRGFVFRAPLDLGRRLRDRSGREAAAIAPGGDR